MYLRMYVCICVHTHACMHVTGGSGQKCSDNYLIEILCYVKLEGSSELLNRCAAMMFRL